MQVIKNNLCSCKVTITAKFTKMLEDGKQLASRLANAQQLVAYE